MSKNKIVKSVSFNITDEQDKIYLDRIKDINFSGYVKKLIDKDIKSRKIIKASNPSPDAPESPSTGAIIVKGNMSLKLV
jgi:hypothetical protein